MYFYEKSMKKRFKKYFKKQGRRSYNTDMPFVAVVEDNEDLMNTVSSYLKLADFDVVEMKTIEELNRTLSESKADILVMDINLSDGDGFTFVKELRKRSDIPVIFMSVRDSESDRITGFEVGADDYVTKPFSPKELVLRIKAVLRRTMKKIEEPGEVWELDSHVLQIEKGTHRAMLSGKQINLTAAEWKILLYLSSNNTSVVTRSQIIDRCLEYTFEGYDRTVDTHIKNLRSKLGTSNWIETVRGYGYRFAGEKKVVSKNQE